MTLPAGDGYCEQYFLCLTMAHLAYLVHKSGRKAPIIIIIIIILFLTLTCVKGNGRTGRRCHAIYELVSFTIYNPELACVVFGPLRLKHITFIYLYIIYVSFVGKIWLELDEFP